MSFPVLDREQTLVAAGDCTQRFVRLLRDVSDKDANAIGHWSIAELACHVSHVYAAVPKMLRGEGSPIRDHRQIAEEWDKRAREDPERDLSVLSARIEAGWAETKDLFDTAGWTDTVAWHGGLLGPAYTIAAVLISEASIHGLDIARTAKLRWEIESEHARMAIFGFMPHLGDFVNHETAQGLDATIELRVRGGWWVYVTASDGALSISQVTERDIDCRLSVDPVSYLLVGFNRENLFAAMAKGKVFAWGRKPWLGLTFAKLFSTP